MAEALILTSEDLALRYDLGRALARRGLEVKLARSGWELVLAAGQATPDLMILDFWLPDMLGDEVLEQLRRQPALQSVPVVLHGLSMSAEVRERCVRLGPVRLVTERLGRAAFLSDLFSELRLRQRREQRVEVRLPLEVRSGERRASGAAVQVSAVGAAVETALSPEVGDQVELAFAAGGGAPAMVAKAVVRRVAPGNEGALLGLEFAEPERMREFLRPHLKACEEIGDLVDCIERFPALPAVAARILEASLSENVDLKALLALVRNDPALASHLIRVANSAAHHFSSKVTTVERAGTLLGLTAVRNAVLGVTVFRHLSQEKGGRLALELWQHSVAVALSCEKLAERFGVDPGEGFVLGLLHDVGKFVLLSAAYRPQEGWAGRALGEHLSAERERELFGMDHAQIGARILERWRLPAALFEVVAAHHDPAVPAVEAHPRARAVKLLQTAEALACGSHLGLEAGEAKAGALEKVKPEEIEALRVGLYRDVARLSAEFGRPIEALELCSEVVERANQHLAARLSEAEEHNEMLRLAYERTRRQLTSLVQTEKYHALGRISRGLAHEINNPLSAALANLHALGGYAATLASAALGGAHRSEEVKEVAADLPAVLEDLEAGLERVQAIVQALGAFDRDGTRRLESGNLRQCVQEAVQLAGPSRPGGVKIRVGEGQVRDLPLDRGGMVRALVELILNAFAAMPGGGALDIDLREEADAALVVLRDTGEGISEENLERVFEPFFTTRPMGFGRGLGLSAAYAIVSRMNGRITLTSAPSQGTVAQVRLPTLGGGAGAVPAA
jgi:putative nucleotidyltransferase with HDIG domain